MIKELIGIGKSIKKVAKTNHYFLSSSFMTLFDYLFLISHQDDELNRLWERAYKSSCKRSLLIKKKTFLQKLGPYLTKKTKRRLTTEFIGDNTMGFERRIFAKIHEANQKTFEINEKYIDFPENKNLEKQWEKLHKMLRKVYFSQQIPGLNKSQFMVKTEKNTIKKMYEVHKLFMKSIHIFNFSPPRGGIRKKK